MGVAIVQSGRDRVAVTTKTNVAHSAATAQAVRYSTSPRRAVFTTQHHGCPRANCIVTLLVPHANPRIKKPDQLALELGNGGQHGHIRYFVLVRKKLEAGRAAFSGFFFGRRSTSSSSLTTRANNSAARSVSSSATSFCPVARAAEARSSKRAIRLRSVRPVSVVMGAQRGTMKVCCEVVTTRAGFLGKANGLAFLILDIALLM